MNAKYVFYMQKAKADGTADGLAVDIEQGYPGLHYLSIDGLETVGKVKNIYTESYPEASSVRVFHPSDAGMEARHEQTTVTLSLLFSGDTRRDALDSFRNLLYSGRLFYWDTARHRKVLLIVENEQTVEKDSLKGLRCIQAKFSFTNLWGRSKACTDDGTEL